MLAVTLARSGLKRRDLFLRRSDLNSVFQGKPVFQRSVSWRLVGGVLFVVVSWLTILFLALSTRLVSGALPLLVLNLPLILTAAALNAFVEEFGWRSALLVRSTPVKGTRQANWLQAAYFGLNHYFGTPGGLAGTLMNIALGWMFGKSVTETRGFTVNYVVHVAADSIIFTFFVMAAI
jgi:membrane protease YdiL (CAAX protease family)